ncbi:GntR family transcriptional regulator [Hoeflea alexandrii]|uniref:GntR family transcriptional regulator n=1 Tax=Hoeflea alexandrii TaxID=288436 RepID=UPI0022AE9309|nr:GntR family transcriptional regulator [Hoeflea alexandrii]
MATMTDALESLTPIGRSDTLAQKVRTQLKEAVMAGRFAPGEKLTIRSIAGALEVSLTPAREALYNLASEGVLELRPNGSVYVPELTMDRIAELTKIRIVLESLAAREAVTRASNDEIANIVALNENLIQRHEQQDYSALISLNWQFHFTLYRASRMETLVRMIESCWLMTGSYLNVIYPQFAEVSEGITNHQQIVRALERRDGDRVAAAITTDINLVSDALISSIKQTAKPEQDG